MSHPQQIGMRVRRAKYNSSGYVRSSMLRLGQPRSVLTFHHADFHRFDADADFFQPRDGRLHFVARAVKFEADDPDFVGHAGLADVGDHLEFPADFPDERFLDELGRKHQPQSSLGWGCGFCRW